jgi:hypothetical protein
MVLVQGGYTPDVIMVEPGKPVRLTFVRQESASGHVPRQGDRGIGDATMSTELPEGNSWLRSRSGLVLLGVLAIAAFFIVTEHTVHVLSALLYLLLLVCPLLHWLHGGHRGGHGGDGRHGGGGGGGKAGDGR